MLRLLVELLSARPSAVPAVVEFFACRDSLVDLLRATSSLKLTVLGGAVPVKPLSLSFVDVDMTEECRRLLDSAAVFATRALLLFMISSGSFPLADEASLRSAGDESVMLMSKMSRSRWSLRSAGAAESAEELLAVALLRDTPAVELERRSFTAAADLVGLVSRSSASLFSATFVCDSDTSWAAAVLLLSGLWGSCCSDEAGRAFHAELVSSGLSFLITTVLIGFVELDSELL